MRGASRGASVGCKAHALCERVVLRVRRALRWVCTLRVASWVIRRHVICGCPVRCVDGHASSEVRLRRATRSPTHVKTPRSLARQSLSSTQLPVDTRSSRHAKRTQHAPRLRTHHARFKEALHLQEDGLHCLPRRMCV